MDHYGMLVQERMATGLREARQARLAGLVLAARRRCQASRLARARRRLGQLLITAGTALAGSPTRRRTGQRPLDRPA